MTTSVQTDALLGRFAVLAYKNPAEVSAILVEQFPGWTISPTVKPFISSGFAAYTFAGPNGQAVIAYRGTDSAADLSADSKILKGGWDGQFTQALRYAGEVEIRYGANVLVTGHSLGGALAQLVSKGYGYDGATLDPGAVASNSNAPEFNVAMQDQGLPSGGTGVPASFNNYSVYGSAVSGASVAHLGNVQYMPGLAFTGKDAFITGALTLLLPPVGIAYGLAADQFGNKHSSNQVAQALNLLKDTGVEDFSQVTMTPVTRQEPIAGEVGGMRTVIVPGAFDVKDANGVVLMTLTYSGTPELRVLDVRYPNGTEKSFSVDKFGDSIKVSEFNENGVVVSSSTITQDDQGEHIALAQDSNGDGTVDLTETVVDAFDAEHDHIGEIVQTWRGNQVDRTLYASVDGRYLSIDQHATMTDAGPDGRLDDWDFTTTSVHIAGQTGTAGMPSSVVNGSIDEFFDAGGSATNLISGRYAAPGSSPLHSTVAAIDDSNPTGTPITPAAQAAAAGNPSWTDFLSSPTGSRGVSFGSDAVSLIAAWRSGKPLAIATAVANLFSHQIDSLIASDIAAGLSGIGSLIGLGRALEKGDIGRILLDGGGAARSALTIYSNVIEQQIRDKFIDVTLARMEVNLENADAIDLIGKYDSANAVLKELGTAIAIINIANSLIHGDIKGAVISAVALIPVWGTAAALVLSAIDTIATDLTSGNQTFEANGSFYMGTNGSVGIVLGDHNGGANVPWNKTMSTLLQNTWEQAESMHQALGTQFGIIPERLPHISYKNGEMFLNWTDSATGAEMRRTFDVTGTKYLMPGYVENLLTNQPWGAAYDAMRHDFMAPGDNVEGGNTANTELFFMDIGRQFTEIVHQNHAIAPLWEVQTANMQRGIGKTDGVASAAYASIEAERHTGHNAFYGGITPWVLDLDNSAATGKAPFTLQDRAKGAGVLFDIDDDGFAENIDWVSPRDGLLVLDRNNDGAGHSVKAGMRCKYLTNTVATNDAVIAESKGAAFTNSDCKRIQTVRVAFVRTSSWNGTQIAHSGAGPPWPAISLNTINLKRKRHFSI